MALTWYINRVNIATAYGCYVEGSSGVLDMPKMKDPLSADINDHHGESVSIENVRYQGRDIILSCFIFSDSMDDFNTKIINLRNALAVDGLLQLTITGLTKPLSYMVVCKDGFTVSKQWRANSKTIGTFQLRLYEPCPVKRILQYVGSGTMGFTIPLADVSGRIYWGDGQYSSYGDLVAGYITHDFGVAGTYYIVITGHIDGTADYGGATLLWSQLL